MKFNIILLIYLLSFIFGNTIIHEVIKSSEYGIPISIKAYLNIDEKDIFRFSLLYRPIGNIEYIETPMNKIGESIYSAEISGDFVKREKLEYYLLLETVNQKQLFFPSFDAAKHPISVQINPLDINQTVVDNDDIFHNHFDIKSLIPDIVIISPQPGERVTSQDLFIAISYFKIKDVDPAKISVFLDDQDVTTNAQIDSTFLSIPTDAITPGLHNVRVKITNIYDQKFDDFSWSFIVSSGEMLNFGKINKKSGNISAHYIQGRANDSPVNFSDFNSNYNIDFDWLLMDLMYYKSSLENKFSQPMDRFYLHFSNEFMKIKIGDSYPFVDDVSWNGKRLRGINFIFDKRPFFLNIVNGTTARSVQGDPNNNAIFISSIDSTLNNWSLDLNRKHYTFQQDASALKLKLQLGENKFWDMNYIKVKDNIPTVTREINDAIINIPYNLIERVNTNISIEDYFLDTTNFNIRYDSLMNNYKDIFVNIDSIYFSNSNWYGNKPKENYLVGTNFQYSLDNHKILLKGGLSFSLYNANSWTSIENISQLDTLLYDEVNDGMFFEHVIIDTNKNIFSYESLISYGRDGKPLIPFFFKDENLTISNFLNFSSLNRYSILELRYLGHHVKIGEKRIGPDYYSILVPYLKTNYKEKYISDALNLFKNKLLLYYKKSNITENLYDEQIYLTKTSKSLFNISLYPGLGLPTFNFGFQTSNRSNGINVINTINDTTFIIINDNVVDSVFTDTLDMRVNLFTKQFNMSMTNQFKLWGHQILSVNLLLFDQQDLISQSDIKYSEYIPMDTFSEAFGINLKSIYNESWQSTISYNKSKYKQGKIDQIHYNEQELKNFIFKLTCFPKKYFKNLSSGIHYSSSIGTFYHTQYNLNMNTTSKLYENFDLELYFDYRIKYLGSLTKSIDDFFFKFRINYDIN